MQHAGSRIAYASRRGTRARRVQRSWRITGAAAVVAISIWLLAGLPVTCTSWCVGESAFAHSDQLPPGPIADRHELMEAMGKDAKAISEASKAGDPAAMVAPARAIASRASRIPGLFPPGSTHPESRAKPEIWQKFSVFEEQTKTLETRATALAEAAAGGGDVSAAVRGVMMACKSCHDDFRTPEKE